MSSTAFPAAGTPSRPGPSVGHLAPARRPGRGAYAPAVIVGVLGVLVASIWTVTAVLDQVQRPADFARADLPGPVTVQLTQTGTHVVYVEVARGAAGDLTGTVTVTDPSGTAVDLRPYGVDLRYDAPDGLLGTAVGAFDAERTGTFTVAMPSVPAADDVSDGARLAVGDDLAPGVLRAVGLPALTALLSVVGGVVLATLTWSRRQSGTQAVEL